MSGLDTLMITFQTQLSDVMETVLKTAMFEVTRLVEDGFMEEVKRRNQEVEALRIQLQWAERRLSEQEERKEAGKRVECAEDDAEMSSDSAELRLEEQQDEILRDCDVKKEEDDCAESWTRSCQEVKAELVQAAETPAVTQSPESSVTEDEEEEEDMLLSSALGVKEEEVNKPSCSSVHLGVWSGNDGETGAESHSSAEMTEVQQKQSRVDNKELLLNAMKHDPQIATTYVFHTEQDKAHMVADPPSEADSDWAGLTTTTTGLFPNHRRGADTDCDPATTREHKLVISVSADGSAVVAPSRDQSPSSESALARRQDSDALGVTIKQEVVVDSDDCVDNEHNDKKMTKAGTASFSSSVKPQRANPGPLKQNHVSYKSTAQEVLKLHSKAGAGVRLQAAIQHLQRPMKKTPHALTNSAAAALSIAHAQVVNVNTQNRIPSTSKAAVGLPLAVQRVHLVDKQGTALHRAGAPWASVKTQLQTANSHHANPLPHPDSNLHVGPRHLLRCGQCGMCFPHPSNLKSHMQTHTGERPFCCSLCGRSFTKLSNLKAHRRVHTGERPYCCLACGKRFTQKCNLKRHQRIHLDV